MLYIFSYFCVGVFTKSFIFGTVKVDLKKLIKWCTRNIKTIDIIVIWITQDNILYYDISLGAIKTQLFLV